MRSQKKTYEPKSHFYLNKWYLDFIGKNGDVMIFYSAVLKWHGFMIHYSNWLHCDKSGTVKQKSRFRDGHLPTKNNNIIHWNDPKFGINGVWRQSSSPVDARVFESDEGELDWKCYQPASDVELLINGEKLSGKGYAEQILLSVPVWKIPMDELRWGRIHTEIYKVVWIEITSKEKKQWFWLNEEPIDNCKIGDKLLIIPNKNIRIKLDQNKVLESEKKIMSLVEKLMKYIPGLKSSVPVNFLFADESKWCSKATVYRGNDKVEEGMAIHEYVNFNSLQK